MANKKKKAPLKDFTITVRWLATETVSVKAKNAEEAEKKYMERKKVDMNALDLEQPEIEVEEDGAEDDDQEEQE